MVAGEGGWGGWKPREASTSDRGRERVGALSHVRSYVGRWGSGCAAGAGVGAEWVQD
jgi:hypothetical protein